jgi:peptide/nickel transport system permease protein
MNGHRRILFLVIFLVVLHLLLIFPGFFSPYDFSGQNRHLPFAPPSRLHFVDAARTFHPRPFVYAWRESMGNPGGAYEEDHTRMYPVRFLKSGSPYSIIWGWRGNLHLFGIDEPGRIFLFGTDDFGRDEFSRMLYGGRISLLAGLLGACIALFVGGLLGIISGFYGEWVDATVMRVLEVFLALPWLYLLFAVRAVLPLRIKTTDVFLLLVAVMGLVGWARPARIVRGIVLSVRERNFVLAARAMGASDLHILRRHVVPQTISTMLTMAALLVPQFILAEVTLSFLGLGVGEPIPSWGNLLAELQRYSVLTSYWWMYLPAIALVALFLAYHVTSVALQEWTAMVNL